MSTNTLFMLLSASTAFAAVAPAYAPAPVYGSTTSAPSYTTGAPVSDCAKTCVEAYRACQTGPDANQSLCASQLASCVNYNPFDNSGSFVTPTACSAKSASSTATQSAPAYTTSASTSDNCAANCVKAYRECQSDTSNTRALCASNLASCVNYNPFDNSGSFVTPTACSAKSASSTASHSAPAYTSATTGGSSDCAKDCVAKYRACQTAPGSNKASCASDLASCVNYNPFDNSGSFVTPTACSSKASSTAASTTSAPAPAYTTGATGGQSDCAKKCVEAYRACQSDTSNTRALCASNLASCVNYNPFDNSGSFVTPTACSSGASSTAAATTSAPAPAYTTGATGGQSDCAKKCVEAYRTCQSDTSNTRALCASNLASCVNYNPFDNSGSFVTPTACSGSSTAAATASGSSAPMGSAPATYAPGAPAPKVSSPASYAPGAPAPAPSAPTSASGCAEACVSAYRTCQSDRNNNRSLCASNLATCIGYNPFDNSGSFVTPTACSSTGAAKPTMAGNGTMMGTASATYSAPAQYTGGASLMSGSFMAVAAGAVGLLL